MKEVLQTILENLVDNKEAIEIKETQNEKNVMLEVKVAQEDMGKIIGRKGCMAKSIRTVMQAMGMKEYKRVSVEFVD